MLQMYLRIPTSAQDFVPHKSMTVRSGNATLHHFGHMGFLCLMSIILCALCVTRKNCMCAKISYT